MRGGKRELSQEAERTWAESADVTLATSEGTSIPIFRAWADCRLQRVAFLPRAAFTRHASNYWTFALAIYDSEGTKDRTLRNTSLALDDFGFAVGQAVVLPPFGRLDELMQAGEVAHVVAAETGTAADVDVSVQVDVTRR